MALSTAATTPVALAATAVARTYESAQSHAHQPWNQRAPPGACGCDGSMANHWAPHGGEPAATRMKVERPLLALAFG